MKEELGFVGDQYNQINTCFTVGYVHTHRLDVFYPLLHPIVQGTLTTNTAKAM
jgi:hypothetical protein